MTKTAALVWFRNDLRLADNPALLKAISSYSYITPVFIYSSEEEGNWSLGAASRWWLHDSLATLIDSLAKTHTKLIIRKGPVTKTLLKIAQETSAKSIFYNRRYEPWANTSEQRVVGRTERTAILPK